MAHADREVQTILPTLQPCRSQNVTCILSENLVARIRGQLREHWQSNGAVRVADLVREVGAEHDAVGTDELDQKAKRGRARHHGVIVEVPQILTWRLADVRAASGI